MEENRDLQHNNTSGPDLPLSSGTSDPQGWHPKLPVYGDPGETAPADLVPEVNTDTVGVSSQGIPESIGREDGPGAGGSETAQSGTEAGGSETAQSGTEVGGSETAQNGTEPAESPKTSVRPDDSQKMPGQPTEIDLKAMSDRIILQSEKEIEEDEPTQEELRRRQELNRQRRARIDAAHKRDEKKYRRTKIELRVIIALLIAGIAACAALVVILINEPDIEFTVLENLPTWESVVETVTETVEEIAETTEEESEEEEEEAAELEGVTYVGIFELPIEGATGYAPVAMSVTDDSGSKVGSLSAGEAFTILDIDGEYFHIEMSDGTAGRVSTSCTWVNLPDVIPSIIYYDVNADSSIFRSSGYNLPGITGEQLYTSKYMNERFGEEEYCMPVLYEMAVKIMNIQQACLANGQSLKIYQTFRPYETQMAVADALQTLESSNSEVYAGLNTGSWSDTWFIATKLSNHQRGCAIDVSLVQVDATEQRLCAGYLYTVITDYTEYTMPSDMHELSYKAAVFDPPVSSSNDTAWRSAQYADTMTTYAYQLQDYCTTYGLSPLSSEWWHFNDLEAKSDAGSNIGTGNFYLTECLSREPAEAQTQ